ncbi:MAG: antibiotic biosynthesis monooxygenase, partial [Actinobacteria bacterium]|nr:antibiotic biosynthesis monooxygenase [Actinomycetota bacterium]
MSDAPRGVVTVLWEAQARAGKEDDMKAFMTAAVTPSRNDPGNVEYEAHEVEGQPGRFIIFERWISCPGRRPDRRDHRGEPRPGDRPWRSLPTASWRARAQRSTPRRRPS